MTTAFAPPPQTPPAPAAMTPPPGMPVSGGFTGQPLLAADNSLEGRVMPPAMPVAQPQARPQWPSYPQAAAQSQPQYPAQQQLPAQQYQQLPAQQAQPLPAQYPVAPQPAPAPTYPLGQQPMGFDPLHAPGAQHQFNDGLALAGPAGGGPRLTSPLAPAGASAALMPAGVVQPQVPAAGQIPAPAPQQFAPAQPTTSIRDGLMRQGLSVGHYQNDDQLLADIGSTLASQQQLAPIIRLGYEALEQRRAAGTPVPAAAGGPVQAASPQPNQPNQPAPQPARPAAPEWRTEWESLVRLDDRTGRFVAVDPLATNPLVVERANEYASWRRQRAESMLRDPIGTLRAEGLDQILQQHREQVIQELEQRTLASQQAEEAEQITQQFLEQNRASFFQLDAQGNPITNPINGQPALTPVGTAAAQHAQVFRQQFLARYGHEPHALDVTSHVRQSLAQDQAQGRFGNFAPPQVAGNYQPQNVPQQQLAGPGGSPFQVPPAQQSIQQAAALAAREPNRLQAMNGMQYQPNQLGTIAAAAQQPEYAQNPNLSFGDMLRQKARERGIPGV